MYTHEHTHLTSPTWTTTTQEAGIEVCSWFKLRQLYRKHGDFVFQNKGRKEISQKEMQIILMIAQLQL